VVSVTQDTVTVNEGVICEQWIRKNVEVPYLPLPGRTEGNHKNQSGQLVSRTLWIQSRNAIHLTRMFSVHAAGTKNARGDKRKELWDQGIHGDRMFKTKSYVHPMFKWCNTFCKWGF
jgi:hypothetical protein